MNEKQKNLKKEKLLQQKRKRSKSSSNKSVFLDIKVTSFQERYQKSIDIVNKLKQRNINQNKYEKISSVIKICDMNEELMEKFLDYQYENDFKSFSLNFPNYIFVVSKEKRNKFQNLLKNKKDSSIPLKHFKKDSMKNVFEKLLSDIFKKKKYSMDEFEELKNSC